MAVATALTRILRGVAWVLSGTPAQKRRVRQECARIAAACFGDFPLSEDHKLWREDREFLADYARLSPGNPYSQDRKYTLREFAKFVRNVPGSMAECGVFKGASAFFLAKENPTVPLHLFDSFEGLGGVGEVDRPQRTDVPEWQPGDLSATEAELRAVLAAFSNWHVHRGWIPERFGNVAGDRFRLVHIDVDLFEPTLASLEFFYPRMNPGGVIVLDDFGFATCPGAHHAVRNFMRDKAQHVLHLPTGQGVIIFSQPERPPLP